MVAARRPDGRRIPFCENPKYTLVLQKKIPTVAIVSTYGINRYLPRWGILTHIENGLMQGYSRLPKI